MSERRAWLISLAAVCVLVLVRCPPAAGGRKHASKQNSWRQAGSMNERREYPGLVVLSGGHVLAATGHPIGRRLLASAELYDPAADRWSPTGSLAVARNGMAPNTAVLLPSGNVLVAGGHSGGKVLDGAELYDAATGRWSATGAMKSARSVETATLLPTGKVLVTGGINWETEKVLASAELYDPVTGTWSETGAMHSPRFGHRAVLLPDGQVLVAGGLERYPSPDQVLKSAELYDPNRGIWRETGALLQGRRMPGLVLLRNGRVLAVGGKAGGWGGAPDLADAELYDPESKSWSRTGSMRQARRAFTATLLVDGRVLIAGGAFKQPGDDLATCELYDPSLGKWRAAGSMNLARWGHRAVLVPSGSVLVAGGYNPRRGYLSSCEIFDPPPSQPRP